MRSLLLSFCACCAFASPLAATRFLTYNGDDNQAPADPAAQGWTVTGSLARGFTDASNGNTLGWELNDNSASSAYPNMVGDYGGANVPQAGDPWTATVRCRILPGNGSATNVFQWSNGTIRYLCFLYEDASGNIDILYSNTSGGTSTLQDYVVNDDHFHTWAIVHDGTGAKLTYDGATVVTLGSMAASGQVRGVHIGGGSSAGTGALYVSNASFEATLAAGAQTTHFGKVFADHMVLQRNEPVRVFGTDSQNPGTQAITVTFGGQTKHTTTDAGGNWMVTLDPMPANATGQVLSVTGSSTRSLADVLVGEVWLAAGQSNMNFQVLESSNPPYAATYPLIRMCNWNGVVGTGSTQVYSAADFANLTPSNFYSGTWAVMDATSVRTQSAVGYFFAHYLAQALDVPIGIIDTSIGGTSTEAYIRPATHASSPYLAEAFARPHDCRSLGQWTTSRLYKNVYNSNFSGGNYTHADPAKPIPHPYAPGFLYYTGIAHLEKFTFKGVIWYQGESNAEFTTGSFQINGNRLSDYETDVMKTLVADWRDAFGKPDLPFYMVQLPRISDTNRTLWPYYREAQSRVAREVPGCALATIMEYGVNGTNVHPANKEPVGQRLAAIARAGLYGEDIPCSGPVCTGHEVSGGKIVLRFDHADGGLVDHDGGSLRNFQVSGRDLNFVDATAVIVGDTIEVSAASVPHPVAVRHAWHMNADVDLYNGAGFSSSSFRTDRWIAAPGRKLRVACIGDEITLGTGIDGAADKYPARLQALLGTTNFEVQAFATSGSGFMVGGNKFSAGTACAGALAYQPDVVVIGLGCNDLGAWGFTQAAFETEYFAIVDAFIQSGQDPVVIQWQGLPTADASAPNLSTMNQWLRKAVANTNTIMLDLTTPMAGHASWFQSAPDADLPNGTGSREIAEQVFCLLDAFGEMDGSVELSEFMAANAGGIQDGDSDSPGWIELSNPGTGGFRLSHHYLTDDASAPTRWQFPATTVIAPGGKLLVFASGKDRRSNQAELHTDFTLSTSGGYIGLAAPDGTTVLDSCAYPAQYANVSYGRTAPTGATPVATGAAVKVHVPADDSLGTAWTAPAFDDASWTAGTAGVGYDDATALFNGSQVWNTTFQNGWAENNAGTTESLAGTVLRFNHTGFTNEATLEGTASSIGGVAWSSINTGDWTAEVNLKVNAAPNGVSLFFGVGSRIIIVNVYNDRTTDNGSNTFTASHANNDGAFHTFRIAHDSAAQKYQVWRDGVLLTPAGGVAYDATATNGRLLVGDISSSALGDGFDVEIASISYSSPAKLYASAIGTDVKAQMRGVNASAYVRVPFSVTSDPSGVTALSMDIRYDDGFVAYLNGQEVARRNAPASVAWNSAAASDRTDGLALVAETIALTAHAGKLVQGSNVLAIHALNSAPGASRFLVHPTLSINYGGRPAYFRTPTPSADNGDASTGSTQLAAWKGVHGITADDSDTDGDTQTALMEFATGTNPNDSASAAPLATSIASEGTDRFLRVQFRVAKGIPGLTFAIETSSDPAPTATWMPMPSPVLLGAMDNSDGTTTYTYRTDTPLAPGPTQFLRIRYDYTK